MKKIYKTPLTEVVKIRSEKILDGSDEIPVGDSVPSGQSDSGNILRKDEESYNEDLW